MPELSSTDLERTLQELSGSLFPKRKLAAIRRLGQLTESNDVVVRALAIVVSLDSDADVRSAAMQALLSPAHQAFLKDHPGFVEEVTRSATDVQARESEEANSRTMSEFLRRRTRERIQYLILFGSLIAPWVLCLVAIDQVRDWMVQTWAVIVIGFAILSIYLSWRNWRCPVCDSWLGAFAYGINPFWSPHTVRCPQCGVKLA